jgi:anthranilate phosphoribosyltransferase
LAALGLSRGFVVHGSDGLDEITTTGSSLAFEIREGRVERRTLEPEDFAIHRAATADLKGGDHARNFEIARAIFAGERGPRRDIVLVNSAAALVAAGKVDTFLEGMAISTVSIDTGAARGKLDELTRFTQACG